MFDPSWVAQGVQNHNFFRENLESMRKNEVQEPFQKQQEYLMNIWCKHGKSWRCRTWKIKPWLQPQLDYTFFDIFETDWKCRENWSKKLRRNPGIFIFLGLFRDLILRSIFWCNFVVLWLALGVPSAPFWRPLAPCWRPLASFGLPFDSLWLPFGSLLAPLAALWLL